MNATTTHSYSPMALAMLGAVPEPRTPETDRVADFYAVTPVPAQRVMPAPVRSMADAFRMAFTA